MLLQSLFNDFHKNPNFIFRVGGPNSIDDTTPSCAKPKRPLPSREALRLVLKRVRRLFAVDEPYQITLEVQRGNIDCNSVWRFA